MKNVYLCHLQKNLSIAYEIRSDIAACRNLPSILTTLSFLFFPLLSVLQMQSWFIITDSITQLEPLTVHYYKHFSRFKRFCEIVSFLIKMMKDFSTAVCRKKCIHRRKYLLQLASGITHDDNLL